MDAGYSVGESSDVEVSVVEEPEEEPEITPVSAELNQVQQLLAALRGPVAIQVYRKKPTWCAGFLTEVTLGDREELDLRQLKEDWGGGEIQLRPRIQTASGTKWVKGGGMVKFTGPPRERGREIDPSGYRAENPSAIMVETRPAPVKPVSDGGPMMAVVQGMFGMMQSMMQGMMQSMQQQARPGPVVSAPAMAGAPANPLTALHEALKVHKEISRAFGPEPDEEEEAGSPLERLVMMGLEHLDKKQSGATQENPKGFRLHKADPAETPAANRPATKSTAQTKLTARAVLDFLRDLPEDKRMDILGTLSAELPPDVIREWMTQNMEASAG